MMRLLTTALLATALLLTPFAAAQEENASPTTNEMEGEQAWVDDCPPDMMCAMEEPTYGDCGAEVCAYDSHAGDPNAPVSNDTDEGSTCMDGEQENETCRDDVRYLDGGSDGSSTTEADPIRGEAEVADAERAVPAPGLALLALGLLGAALVLAAPRSR